MSYSNHNPAFGRQRDQQHAARVNDEARLANDLQASLPGISRTEALREASRLIDKHGAGLTVWPSPMQNWHHNLWPVMYWLDRRVNAAKRIRGPLQDHLIDGGYCLDRIGD
jgi:hypothetical protein